MKEYFYLSLHQLVYLIFAYHAKQLHDQDRIAYTNEQYCLGLDWELCTIDVCPLKEWSMDSAPNPYVMHQALNDHFSC